MNPPKKIALLLTSLVATCAAHDSLDTKGYKMRTDVDGTPHSGPCAIQPPRSKQRGKPVVVCLGPYRFRLPMNLFYGQAGQGLDKANFTLAVQWPRLEPLPQGQYFYKTTPKFLANISIDLTYLERVSDAEYPTILVKSTQPLIPGDPRSVANPERNIVHRIKGGPIYGLTPYYADFDKIRAYNAVEYAPNQRDIEYASRPENHEEWFIRADTQGTPTTFISCSSRFLPDGAHLEGGVVVDDIKPGGRRSTCQHAFLIPEYKVAVSASYMRIALPDWQRIETYVRELLKSAEVR